MLKPIGKRILVKPEEEAQSLIVVNTKPKRFCIIAIGDEVTKVKTGQIVYLDKYAGSEIEHEKEKFFVIDEQQILAKID